MKDPAVVACCVLCIGSMEAIGQEPPNCTGPQLGTWKLQSFTTEDLATGQKTDLFGAHPSGYLSYGPDCRMSAILVKEGRKAPNSFVPTDAERVDLYSGFIAYAGTYSIEGDKVSHHIDASWNQSWTGTTQVRQFRSFCREVTRPENNPRLKSSLKRHWSVLAPFAENWAYRS